MKKFKRCLSVILIISFVLCISSLPVSAIEPAMKTNETRLPVGSCAPSGRLYFDCLVDTTQSYLCTDGVIPVAFNIGGLRDNDACTLNISSTLQFDSTLNSTQQFTATNHQVVFSIEILEEFSIQSLNNVTFDSISITASPVGMNSDLAACTIELFIINSQYGVFVGYINEECLSDYFTEWLYLNGKISSADYKHAIELEHMAIPITSEEYEAVLSNSAATRSNTIYDTQIFILHRVTASNGGAVLTVSGSVMWTDINYNSHVASGVKIEIIDDDVQYDDPLGTVYADSNGTFSFTFNNQTGVNELGGCDLLLRIYASTENIVMDNSFSIAHRFDVKVGQNISDNISDSFSQYGANNNISNAFQILQAAYVGAKYYEDMSGSAAPTVTIGYPYPNSNPFSCMYVNNRIYIQDSYYYVWDVILHEYGHFIDDCRGDFNLLPATHNATLNLIDEEASVELTTVTKTNGCNLAWQEGLATYYGIAAQVTQSTSSYNIPYVGDNISYDPHWPNLSENLENDSYTRLGEGNEYAIAAVLWDLSDAEGTTGSHYESHDSIFLGANQVWTLIQLHDADRFSDFMVYFYSYYGNTSSVYHDVGGILGEMEFSAKSLSCSGLLIHSPVFRWTQTIGSEKCLDDYYLVIFEDTMTTIYSIAIPYGTTSYELSYSMYENVKSRCSDKFYWTIRAHPRATPTTGPYYAQIIEQTIY